MRVRRLILEALIRMEIQLGKLGVMVTNQGDGMNEKVQKIVDGLAAVATNVATLTTAVAPLPGAVNDMEATVTDLKAKLAAGTLSAEDLTALDASIATLGTINDAVAKAGADVTAAVADAKDGVDEAAAGGV